MNPLKHLFWSRMDDLLGQMLLVSEGHRPFIEFVEHALWVCGSSLTVGVVEDNIITSNFPGPSTPSAAISIPAPDRTHHPSLEGPDNQRDSPLRTIRQRTCPPHSAPTS